MVRLLSPSLAVLCLALGGNPATADERQQRHDFSVQIDLSYLNVSSDLTSWVDGGVGKLRYDEDSDGLIASRAFAEYRGRLSPTLTATAVLDYTDDASGGLDLTEAYLKWRPVPKSQNRTQWKFGAFYPRMSLENPEAGWVSPYTLTNSAVNSWIAEEIRTLGAEWSNKRRMGPPGSQQEIGLFGAIFYANDPSGTILAFRGWSLHDRQSRLGDRLPLPRGGWLEPVAEIDDSPGYYAGVEWRYTNVALLRATHYENRADPAAFSDGQWAWETQFSHVGAQFTGPWGLGLIAQWMKGDTIWIGGATESGEIFGSGNLIDTDYEASFLLVTREQNAHRVTVRYDDFEVTAPWGPVDDGHAWTLAYRYQARPSLTIGAEWLRIDSWHPSWASSGLNPGAIERQLRLQLTLRFDNIAF